jgi:geranylgeranyl diphosphate synthase type II
MTLAEYLDVRRLEIDEALARFLPGPPDCPPLLHDAMRYSLDAGGKRLRPILTLAAAEAVAGAPDVPDALPAACALELIHTYSLIHDDLPAMDDDTMRRGRPTSHVVFGEGIAILAGDGLLTEAFHLMAREPAASDPTIVRRKLRALQMVAAAAGAAGMVGGQAIDLAATRPQEGATRTRHAPIGDADALRGMHARKTGALIRAAAGAGAIMAGGSDPLIAAIDEYASHVGLAFQIVDDILDVEGAAGELGKTAGKDAASGKPTYPAFHGLERSKRLARECLDAADAALDRAGVEGRLRGIARWVVERRA